MSELLDALNAYQSFAEQDDKEYAKRKEKGIQSYRLFNPHNWHLESLLLTLPQEEVICAYYEFFRQCEGTMRYSEHIMKTMAAAFKRKDPPIFTEFCLYSIGYQDNESKKDSMAYMIASSLSNHYNNTDSKYFYQILNTLFQHPIFRTADFSSLLENIAHNKDKETAGLLLSQVDMEALSPRTQADNLIEKGGDEFFLFLIELGLSPRPAHLSVDDIVRIFGQIDRLPAHLPEKHAGALPIIMSVLLNTSKLTHICPVSFIASLPSWQQPCVTDSLLQDIY